jgi:hypothetical protein
MLKLLQRSETPPDKYRFTFREDGYRISNFSYDGWLAGIKKHATDNGYVLPENWVALAEDQLCRLLPPGWCKYEDGRPHDGRINARMSLDDVLNGGKVFLEFVKSGGRIVEQEEAERRGRICAGCYMRSSIPGCAPCVGLSNLVAEVCGAQSTESDPLLESKSCLVFKCPAKANIWIPVDTSKVGVTAEMLPLLPETTGDRGVKYIIPLDY